LRLSSLDGRLRASLQRRPPRSRPRLRLRPSEPLAFFLDGVLAHGGAEWRRDARMARTAGGSAIRRGDAKCDRGPRDVAIAGGTERQTLAARLRRSNALPPRRN